MIKPNSGKGNETDQSLATATSGAPCPANEHEAAQESLLQSQFANLENLVKSHPLEKKYTPDKEKYKAGLELISREEIRINQDVLKLARRLLKRYRVTYFRIISNGSPVHRWNREDTAILVWLLDNNPLALEDYVTGKLTKTDQTWSMLASCIPGRSAEEVMLKWLRICSPKLYVQPKWTQLEDGILSELVEEFGSNSWLHVSRALYERLGARKWQSYILPKHCKRRWRQRLNPQIKRNGWTMEEDTILLKSVASLGFKWARITHRLEGRTGEALKNRFRSLVKSKSKSFTKRKCAALLESLERKGNKNPNSPTRSNSSQPSNHQVLMAERNIEDNLALQPYDMEAPQTAGEGENKKRTGLQESSLCSPMQQHNFPYGNWDWHDKSFELDKPEEASFDRFMMLPYSDVEWSL